MKNKELIKKISEEITAKLPNAKLMEMKYSTYEVLKRMYSFPHIEYAEIFYDNEEDAEEVTWYDIEGEGYGWHWAKYRHNPSIWVPLLCSKLSRMLAERYENKMEGRAMLVVENEGTLRIIVPLQDIDKRNLLITLSNNVIDPTQI